MTHLIIDPQTYQTTRISVDWQDSLDSLLTDCVYSCDQLQNAITLETMADSEDARRDAESLLKALSVMVDALMAFENHYVRAE